MHKIMKQVAAAFLAAGFMTMPMVSAEVPPMLGVSDIYPGMHGKAYTVVDSTGVIKSFDVDVIGTIDEGKGSSKRIMAKASGPVVEKTGGTLQGMSGSPVYIDGKLVGALSAGIKNMDPFTFLITPIADMLPIWDMPDHKNATKLPQVDFRKIETQKQEKLKADQEKAAAAKAKNPAAKGAAKNEDTKGQEDTKNNAADAAKVAAESGDAAKQPATVAATDAVKNTKTGKTAIKVPLQDRKAKSSIYLAGFGTAGTNFLEQKLAPLGFSATDFSVFGSESSAGQVTYNASLQPGGAVGVAVVYGDFSVGATGTVTATDGNKVLAFGHPFLHKGNVNFFMTDATVVGTVSGQSDGMKIANIGNIIGRINQDREAGIGGILGTYPSVVPIRVTVRDKNLARVNNYSAQIAYDEDYLPALSAGIAYASMDKTSDTLGESTANVHFIITTDAADGGKIERSNMYYNTSDVGQVAVNELAQAMNLVCSNTDKESNILDIKVDVSVDNGRKTASMVSAIPDKMKVKPGDTVNFRTTIKPYRQDKETLLIPYTVPKTQREGALHLDLRGGGFVPVAQLLLQQTGVVDTGAEEDRAQTTADKIRDFLATGKNNEIIIAPAPAQGLMSEDEQKAAIKKAIKQQNDNSNHAVQGEGQPAMPTVDLLGQNAKKKSNTTPGESKFVTKYIIDNVIHATLQVEKK